VAFKARVTQDNIILISLINANKFDGFSSLYIPAEVLSCNAYTKISIVKHAGCTVFSHIKDSRKKCVVQAVQLCNGI